MDDYQTNDVIRAIQTIAEFFEKKNHDYYHEDRNTLILTDISNALQGIESRLESLSAELIERAFINAKRETMEKYNDSTEGATEGIH